MHVARLGERRGAYRVLVGKLEGKSLLGIPRRRWEDNIKLDLQEVWWGAWTGSTWCRIGTGGGLLWMREGIFRFRKRRRIYWLVEKPVNFSKSSLFHGISSVSEVSYIFFDRFQLWSMAWQSFFKPATFYHISTFSFWFHFNFFSPSLKLRNSFVPLICFHLAAPLGNGLPLVQLDISFTWMEPLVRQTPRFAIHPCNLQHWFLKRRSPACT